MSTDKNNSETQMFLWFMALFLVLVVLPALYARNAHAINGKLLTLCKLQLQGFVPFFAEAQTAWEYITKLEPATLSWEKMQAVLSYTGKWIRWPYFVLLAIFGAVSILMGRTSSLVRRLNMESLLRNNAESFACLRPIVGRGKYLLSPESYDTGYWRIARTPAQFALEQGLLLDTVGIAFTVEQGLHQGLAHAELPAYGNAHLDTQKTAQVLREQLGLPFTGYNALSPLRRALASAFMAYANGDKKECVAILDALSASYTENHTPACTVLKNPVFEERLTKAFAKHKAVLDSPLCVRHSAFQTPWFMGLLTKARHKGVLASSQFLWLRPLDRPLWYALNQCGGRAAWAEGFAAWAHYAAEEKAGKALNEAKVQQAVLRLRDMLAAQGWLTEASPSFSPVANLQKDPPSTGPATAIEPPPDLAMVFAAAEETDDYDANQDPELLREQLYEV